MVVATQIAGVVLPKNNLHIRKLGHLQQKWWNKRILQNQDFKVYFHRLAYAMLEEEEKIGPTMIRMFHSRKIRVNNKNPCFLMLKVHNELILGIRAKKKI
jgi:hypothetical protein